MRNKITIIVCILLVVCIAALAVACTQRDENGLIKLSTPKNPALNGSVFSWDEVKNAQEYFISINGEEQEQSVTNTICDLSLMVKGYNDFEIAVRAYGDGEKYGTSDYSKPIIYHKGNSLDVPNIVIAAGEKTATWGEIDRAANYSVKVTDVKGNTLDEITTEELSYSFDKEIYEDYGEYIISVIANPAAEDVEYSPSLAGIKSFYNATVLATPEWNTMSATTISWKAVSAGEDYSVTYTLIMQDEDGNEVGNSGELTSTSYAYRTKFSFDEVGKYIFRIRANGDGNVYNNSPLSEVNDDFTVTKLAPVEAQNVALTYNNDGSAKLTWSIDATNEAYEFTLNLNTYLPNGSEALSDSILKKTISNKLELVKASVYDFYQYDATDDDGITKVDGRTIWIYDFEGYAKVRYNNVDYFLEDADGNRVTEYKHNTTDVDIIYDASKSAFVYDKKQYHDEDGNLVNQDTLQDKVDVLGSDGKQLYYWDSVDGESDINVVRGVIYSGNEIVTHTFELTLDDIFINANPQEDEDKYTINDDRFYGKLYNVSLSTARNESNKYLVSQSVTVDGQYMSYKIPEYKDGKYIVTNAGEYAYIILGAFVNANNTNYYSIEDNIDFSGYEVAQIANFRGTIDGNSNTVSNIVFGNKVLTASGVVNNDNQETLQYAMFVNVANTATIKDVFYVGMSFVGYDVDKLSEDVKAIQVAPIAITNSGTISNALVQIDSIIAQSSDVAGLVITNNGTITSTTVYATLEGRNVGGVMINNNTGARVSYSGFYGKITATIGKLLDDTRVAQISGAGFVVNNSGTIDGSFSIGAIDDTDKAFVTVTAEQVSGIYAGGFAATNSGAITNSYSGEFTLNNRTATVTANGNNAYAGGFVAVNSGSVVSSYSTNEGAASVAGGFVGNNTGSVTTSYSTGGALNADENSDNRGAFVGRTSGTIIDCAIYSRDGGDKVVAGVTSVDDLDNIVDALYGDNSADMATMREQGYRNPIIKGLIYTKDNTTTIRPGQTGEDLSELLTRVALYSDAAEDADVTITVHGDNTGKGNKIVIELSSNDASAPRYIYASVA